MTLTADNLGYTFGGRTVLQELSFTVESGTFLSVLGPNGSGKTTLFRCLLGLLPDYTGRVLLDGRDIRTFSRRQMARKIAYIPQIHRPVFGYSVLDTVLMGAAHQIGSFSRPGRKHLACAWSALDRMGIRDLAERDFSRLSGGEQQLVLIARALAQQADILIMDEPTSALDYGNQFRVLEQVRTLADGGYGILMSTHDPQHALRYADRLLAVCHGSIAALGEPETILTGELIRQLYAIETEFADTPCGRVLVPRKVR